MGSDSRVAAPLDSLILRPKGTHRQVSPFPRRSIDSGESRFRRARLQNPPAHPEQWFRSRGHLLALLALDHTAYPATRMLRIAMPPGNQVHMGMEDRLASSFASVHTNVEPRHLMFLVQ